MTHDDPNNDIPELIDDLQGSLVTPDPAAIYAGLAERRSARKRVLGAAGAFVVILAIAGGAFALTSDGPSTTETASDELAQAASGELDDSSPAVAEDSAPTEVGSLSAEVNIAECANGSTIRFQSATWLVWDLPVEWANRDIVPVTVVVNFNTLTATDDAGLSGTFTRDDGQPRPAPCVGFNYESPPPPASSATTSTIADTNVVVSTGPAELPGNSPGPNALLSIEADIDGEPGVEHIWLDPDGTLHAGDIVGTANVWPISDFWFDEQAELTTAAFDDETIAIVLSLPLPDEEEDPPNVVQIFLIQGQALNPVFEQTLGSFGVTPISLGGDGTVGYVEDIWTACSDAGPTDVVALQRITLGLTADGLLVQIGREDTEDSYDCSLLPG